MPKKTYTLLRGGEPIKITKEEEFLTAIIPDRKAVIELVSHSEVKQMKKVFNNVYFFPIDHQRHLYIKWDGQSKRK
jgi:hypothetical protein